MFRPISIRINILTNFLLVVLLIAISLLGLQYHFSQELAMSAAHKSFSQAAHRLTQHIKSRDQMLRNLLYYSELSPEITLPANDERHSITIKSFTHNMKRSPNLYAMYIGYDNGDFFEVINMDMSPDLYTHFKAPNKTRWTIIKIFDAASGRIKQTDYYDTNLKLISSRTEKSDYFANKRPWFIQASQSDKAIRTDAYEFSNLNQKGISFAKKIKNSNAVITVDVTLKQLNSLLQNLKEDPSNELLLFGSNGQLITSSRLNANDTTIHPSIIQAHKENRMDQLIDYEDNGVKKFAMVSRLTTELNKDSHLGISVDSSVILGPYYTIIIYSLITAVAFLVLTIPLILFMTSRIIKPIKKLMLQNNKIKERHFDEVTPVKTNIIELIDLSDSLVSMSHSIQDYQKQQQELMDAFIRLIADAIDAKSSYTGGHCQRVPEIAIMIAKVASDSDEETFKDFKLETKDQWREFEIGAWLHDCGKVTTPEYVVDKATKMETIYNRIHEIRTRFEVLWRDIEIEYYQRLLKSEDADNVELWKKKTLKTLQEDFAFIAETNIGGEFMSDDKKERIHQIAKQTWVRHFNDRAGLSETELLRYEGIEEKPLPVVEPLLSNKAEHIIKRTDFDEQAYTQQGFKLDVPEHLYNYGEIYNLCVEKGTLTEEERFKINEHVIMSIKMLEMLPYPEHLKQIPEFAGTHHETMIGTGYPRKLSKHELSIPARIMAIADIFEALTASDRPYKKGKTLSEALKIMGFMKKDEHIDADIFALFLRSGVYMDYAKKYLKPDQIDNVDFEALNLL